MSRTSRRAIEDAQADVSDAAADLPTDPAPSSDEKPKRKRRTKAEMAATAPDPVEQLKAARASLVSERAALVERLAAIDEVLGPQGATEDSSSA
jgi:hypothetical protein